MKTMARYKSKSGEWLAIATFPGGYIIGWASKDTCADDAPLGDVKDSSTDREFKISCAAVKPFAVYVIGGDYVFRTKTAARKALAAANLALHTAELGVEWPDWATKALAEGWKAPNGWKP